MAYEGYESDVSYGDTDGHDVENLRKRNTSGPYNYLEGPGASSGYVVG